MIQTLLLLGFKIEVPAWLWVGKGMINFEEVFEKMKKVKKNYKKSL